MEGLNKKTKAFTLVEILIDFMVVSLVATAIVSAYVAATKSINLAKSKMVAVSLANEKMEMIKNMTYDDLATVRGAIYPPGNILDDEVVDRNGVEFNVHTVINYFDDPFDGNADGTIVGKSKDIYPYDYKKVEIIVGINGRKSKLADISTNVAAEAAETPSNTGIINLCVVDSNGAAVSDANVSIKNNEIIPIVDINVVTGESGCLMVPKLPVDAHNHYSIIVSKDGYGSDQTFPRTAQNPNALKPDVNVIAQQVTNTTFVIDKLSKMDINFVDRSGNPIPNVNFDLTGGDLIYNNPDTPRYSANLTADAGGHILVSDLKFDSYNIKILTGGYYLISTVPTSGMNLLSGSTLQVKAVLSNSSTNPAILGISPNSGVIPDNITISVIGRNFANSSNIRLRNRNTGLEIIGTNVSTQAQSKLSVDFSLAGTTVGEYDLIISNQNGESVTQEKGFKIVANP